MSLQKAKSFIPNILVVNKYISNTELGWKMSSVLFPTKGFTQKTGGGLNSENLTFPQE